MPSRCCVPGCRSNYKPTKFFAYVKCSTFSFPRDETVRNKWLKAIRRKNFVPSRHSAVCELHFCEEDFVKSPPGFNRKFPRLKPHAVPSKIFRPNGADDEEFEVNADDEDGAAARDRVEISDFADFLANFESKIKLEEFYTYRDADEIVFFKVKETDETGCHFSVRIVIDRELIVKVFDGEESVEAAKLFWVFPDGLKLTLWEQFINLISYFMYQ